MADALTEIRFNERTHDAVHSKHQPVFAAECEATSTVSRGMPLCGTGG